MIPTHPTDLPDVRLWLIDSWTGPRWRELVEISRMTRSVNGVKVTQYEPLADVHALCHAQLWWVDEDMSTLTAASSLTLPPTTLTTDLVDDQPVLAVFAKPLEGLDVAVTDHHLAVHALLWSQQDIINFGRCIGIATYGIDLDGTSLVPLGRTIWKYDTDTAAPTVPEAATGPQGFESMEEDRRWVAAVNLLASQPLAETTTPHIPRATVRRSQRKKLPAEVRVVGLRHRPARPHDPDGDESKRQYSHRWVVQGFWRQQAYGERWSQRRPVWVHEHIRGPSDKPLIVKDTVHRLSGDPGG